MTSRRKVSWSIGAMFLTGFLGLQKTWPQSSQTEVQSPQIDAQSSQSDVTDPESQRCLSPHVAACRFAKLVTMGSKNIRGVSAASSRSRIWWWRPDHFQRRHSEPETPRQSSGILMAGSSRGFGGVCSVRWEQSKPRGCVGQLYEAKQEFLRHRSADSAGFQNGFRYRTTECASLVLSRTHDSPAGRCLFSDHEYPQFSGKEYDGSTD